MRNIGVALVVFGGVASTGFVADGLAAQVTVPNGTTSGQVVLNDGDVLVVNGTVRTTGQNAVQTSGTTTITNNGTIIARNGMGVMVGTGTDCFTPIVCPTITSPGNVATFINKGTITASHSSSVLDGYGVWITGNVATFENFGTIATSSSIVGVKISGDARVVNNYGTISGGLIGMSIDGAQRTTFYNAGTIEGLGTLPFGSIGLVTTNGLLKNAGTIRGDVAIRVNGQTDIDNSGSIIGTTNAILFGANGQATEDTLFLRSGSEVVGLVDFAGGHDTLNFRDYRGNLVVETAGLETLYFIEGSTRVAGGKFAKFTTEQVGSQLYVKSGESIAAIDVGGVTGGGGGASALTSSIGQITSIASAQLSGFGDFSGQQPLAYAADENTSSAETAVLSQLAVDDPASRKVWITGLGGGSNAISGAARSSLFGGLVAGTHGMLDSQTQLGGLAGVVISSAASASQVVTSRTALAGLYGESDLDVATLSYGLIGGLNAHHSDRSTGGLGTARADFMSWFLAPRIGVSLPVLEGDGHDLSVGLSAQYVAGQVGGYTETGSGANMTVGGQRIGLLDVRAEATGRKELDNNVTLLAKAGVSAETNLGSSTVPITILNTTVNAAVPGGTVYGAYAGLGLSFDLSDGANLTTMGDASIRSDGLVSGAATIRLAGSY